MSGLRYLSLIAIMAISYVLLLLVGEFPEYKNDTDPVYFNKEEINLSSFNYNFFNAVGVVFFAYTN